jgi:hypothetical protein
MRRIYWAVLVAASMGALGCSSTDAAASGPFSGKWKCPFTTNSGYMDSTDMTFMTNGDGTVTADFIMESDPCSLSCSVASGTLTGMPGQLCGAAHSGFTVNTFTFTATGNSATFSITATEHGLSTDDNGVTTPVDFNGSLSGTCTR